jgi:DNA-nicking Smr family endonuclease
VGGKFGDILDSWERSARDDGGENKFENDRDALPADLAARENRHLLQMEPQESLDLHGLNREEAARKVALFLDECRLRGLRKVLIIHGKGNHASGQAVLPGLVRSILETHGSAGRFGPGGRRQGGSGATWVVIRKLDDVRGGESQRSR